MAGRGSLTAQLDALLPDRLADRYASTGARLANLRLITTLAVALLTGALAGAGSTLAIVVGASARDLPFGLTRLLEGLAFSLGLVPAVTGGTGFFAADVLSIIAWVNRRIVPGKVLRNAALVLLGNGLGSGAAALAALWGVFGAAANDSLRERALQLACDKCHLAFTQALALGFMGSVLVCLAVWLCLSAQSTGGKVLALVFPIAALAAGGFEHTVTSFYFVPLGLLIQSLLPSGISGPACTSRLTLGRFVFGNLLPVTLGNVIGGPCMVALVYWLLYLRPKHAQPR